jgi:hypothetical protein
MVIESIQRVYSVTPLYTEQRVYTTAVDPQTDKQYSEIVIYKIYNSQGQTEESYQPKVDVRA